MVAENMTALASLAAQSLVKAATTDEWPAAKDEIARLLSRDDPNQEQLQERRLNETRARLIRPDGAGLDQARSDLATQWSTRLMDLLEVDPGVADKLRALVQQIQAGLPPGMVSAADHAVAAGRDVTITADRGGVAAGAIHGHVAPPNPTRPGPATT